MRLPKPLSDQFPVHVCSCARERFTVCQPRLFSFHLARTVVVPPSSVVKSLWEVFV